VLLYASLKLVSVWDAQNRDRSACSESILADIDTILCEASMVTELNKILSGSQPRRVVKGNQRCGNHVCVHHQGSDVTGVRRLTPPTSFYWLGSLSTTERGWWSERILLNIGALSYLNKYVVVFLSSVVTSVHRIRPVCVGWFLIVSVTKFQELAFISALIRLRKLETENVE
jgi:hypothetical protein